ncbi:uncharacterized protein LOC110035057 isoform X2 [Phalaenopsis equestris]|uniref:uncharacterized protein LOC110035057 isoform X2 n=1 Tax=Phalaenopsis equestris TaxID=78828 RepID=UPI0009E1D43A|nr:uncharacterized protein LOC110035057 isoform X2 [Phalaenopsis equestris]
MALASLRSGNKQAAYRHIRQAKLFSENKAKCISFLERVEEVLAVIAEADSTRKVSEAMQIGARVIKGNMISVEELNVQLQELDGFITDQKQINEVIDEDVEEEFMKLEMELVDEMPQTHIPKPAAPQQAIVEESHDTLSQNLSKLNLEAA